MPAPSPECLRLGPKGGTMSPLDKVEAAAKAVAAAPVAVVVSAGKFSGRGTVKGIPAGLRRMVFQDSLLAWNEKPENRLTDERLAQLMDAEHPGGCHIRPDHMRAIRRLYNEGRHTKAGKVPAQPSLAYGADKKPLADQTGRKRAVPTATAAA